MHPVPIQFVPAVPPVPAGPIDSPLWGLASTLTHHWERILADAVDSITAGTQEERFAAVGNSGWDPTTTPMPPALRESVIHNQRGGATFATLPRPYVTDARPDDTSFARPVFALRYRDPVAIADLLNHPGGLRGHYYASPAMGDVFGSNLIASLLPLLMVVLRDWRAPVNGLRSWLEWDERLVMDSLRQPTVWTARPWANAGLLADHQWGNQDWVTRNDPRGLAPARRQGFLAAVLAAENGNNATTAAFLDSVSAPFGWLGHNPNLGGPNVWRGQDIGASYLDTAGPNAVVIRGVFVNAQGQTWTPLREKYYSLSRHWLGYS